jgi:hypothetical protein
VQLVVLDDGRFDVEHHFPVRGGDRIDKDIAVPD